jgi:hypothetical protein
VADTEQLTLALKQMVRNFEFGADVFDGHPEGARDFDHEGLGQAHSGQYQHDHRRLRPGPPLQLQRHGTCRGDEAGLINVETVVRRSDCHAS